MVTFNADEIYEMAEQIERNGAGFYRKAAGGAARKSADMLLKLAAMEDDHEKTFHEMRMGLAQEARQPATFDPDNQGVLYLRAMAEGKVFKFKDDPAKRLTGQEPIEDILRMAIGLEKDSIVFYTSMKEMAPGERNRARIDDIIQQELGHILTLSNELASA